MTTSIVSHPRNQVDAITAEERESPPSVKPSTSAVDRMSMVRDAAGERKTRSRGQGVRSAR